MVAKIVALGILSLAVLPSCMHPVDRVLHARAEAREASFEARGDIARGACDDVGQYIAKNMQGQRLTLSSAEQVSLLPR